MTHDRSDARIPWLLAGSPGPALNAWLLRAAADGKNVLVLDYAGVGDRAWPKLQLPEAKVLWLDLGDIQRPCRIMMDSSTEEGAARLAATTARVAQALCVELPAGAAERVWQWALGEADSGAPSEIGPEAIVAMTQTVLGGGRTLPASLRKDAFAVSQVLRCAAQHPHIAAGMLTGNRLLGLTAWPQVVYCELPTRHLPSPVPAALAALMDGLAYRVLREDPSREVAIVGSRNLGSWAEAWSARRSIPAVAVMTYPQAAKTVAALRDGGHGLLLDMAMAPSTTDRAQWQRILGKTGPVLSEPWDPGRAWLLTNGEWRGRPSTLSPEASADSAALRRERSRLLRIDAPAAAQRAAQPQIDAEDPFERLCSTETLLRAWLRTTQDHPYAASGLDDVDIKDFSANLDMNLGAIADEIRTDTYRPLPPRWVFLPKRDGTQRRIGVSSLRDRLVQRAVLDVIEPLVDGRMCDRSYAFRPGRGCHQAVASLLAFQRQGYTHLAQADVRSCFDSLDHRLILDQVDRWIGAPRITGVIAAMLRHGLGAMGLPDALGVGVVQGWALSPMLCNLVMDDFDRQMSAAGQVCIRYADDLAWPVRSQSTGEEILRVAGQLLESRLQLRLHPNKSSVRAWEDGWEYLGFRIGGGSSLAIAEDRWTGAAAALRAHTEALQRPNASFAAIGAGIHRLVQHLDGLAAYYLRLGLTKRLAEQWRGWLAEVIGVRKDLPMPVRQHPQWSRLPSLETVLERFGPLSQARQDRRPAVEHTYPESAPGIAEALVLSARDRQPGAAGPDCAVEPCGAAPAAATAVTIATIEGRQLVVQRGGVWLHVAEQHVQVRRRKEVLQSVPLATIDQITVLGHGVGIASHELWNLAAAGIDVVLAGPGSDCVAVLRAAQEGPVGTRLAQARWLGQLGATAAAAAIVAAKIANQAGVLRALARSRGRAAPELAAELRKNADEMRALAERPAEAAVQVPLAAADVRKRLLGLEGLAAARYWAAIRAILPVELKFERRIGRGATDAVNQALNYLYGLLYAQVWRAVVSAGLDPGMGCLHASHRLGGGLVFDLVEELRAAFADRLVWALLGRGWRVSKDGTCRVGPLDARERHTLVGLFRRQLAKPIRVGRGQRTVAALIERQSSQWRDVVLGRAKAYRPFRLRW